jgi:LysR family transcriptional regulator, hydrogen peroxide-inducible genes activator
MISVRQLRYLDALARHRHFGKAAAACHVTQPALSMQLQQMEAELGVRLVERRKGDASLTPAGVDAAERAAGILTALRDLTDAARKYDEPLSSSIRLGLIPTIGPYLLPRLLPALRRDYPDVALSVRESRTERLVGNLLDGELDAVFAALPLGQPELVELPVLDDEFVLAVPMSDGSAAELDTPAERLIQNDKLLLLEEGHCLRDQALDICDVRRTSDINLFGASSLATVVQMVANGMGMTLLPKISLPVETTGSAVRLVAFSEPAPRRTLGLAYRRASARAEDCKALAGVISICAHEQPRRLDGA